jgi:dTDP-4-amino-4,6-dideoxygalactose transaminase
MSDRQIPLAEQCLRGNEAKYLAECAETNFVSPVGPFVDRLEQELALYLGVKHAVACASGTAALHVALHRMAPYRGAPLLGSGAAAEAIAGVTISLPSSVGQPQADQARVIEVVTAAIRPRAAA